MKFFKLESLPSTVLLEVFSNVGPEELLDMRFLSKDLFKIVGYTIKDHLRYSTYYNTHSFIDVQNDFIKKNCAIIKHLNIRDGKLFNYLKLKDQKDFINKFKLLESIEIGLYRNDSRYSVTGILSQLKGILTKVKRIKLNTDYSIFPLNELISFLDSNSLKFLSVNSFKGPIYCYDGVTTFKSFKKLETIELYGVHLVIPFRKQTDFNSDFLPILKNLKSIQFAKSSIDPNMFNYSNQLKRVYLNMSMYSEEKMNFVIQSKALEDIRLIFYFNNHKVVSINDIVEDIKTILNIKSKIALQLYDVRNTCIEDTIQDLPLFTNVEEIVFDNSEIDIQFMFILLNYFPNVNKVKIKRAILSHDLNQPLILPKNINGLLFFIQDDVLEKSGPKILNLLTEVNIVII